MTHKPDYRFALSFGDGQQFLVLKNYAAPLPHQDLMTLTYSEAARRLLAHDALVSAAKAVLNGGFWREDTEYADGLFALLEEALAKAEQTP